MHFFVGDTQAHSFLPEKNSSWNQPSAISRLLRRVLKEEVIRFGAENVVWTPGNNDGPHDSIFHSQDASTVEWANALLDYGIVTNSIGLSYKIVAGGKTEIVNQTRLFQLTGFYMKRIPAISNAAYAIVLNTNLGGKNPVQTSALGTSLKWVQENHVNNLGEQPRQPQTEQPVVYILGHHPSVMSVGVGLVNVSFQSLVGGVFAGHVHYASSTTKYLFTQVPAITQAALNVAYFIATVSSSSSKIHLTLTRPTPTLMTEG